MKSYTDLVDDFLCCEYGFIGRKQMYLFPLYDIFEVYKVTVLDFPSELLSIVFGLLLEVFLFLICGWFSGQWELVVAQDSIPPVWVSPGLRSCLLQ